MENPFEPIYKRFDNIEMILADLLSKQPVREEKLHTVKSIAQLADVAELTVRNWVSDGKIKAKKIGGVIRIQESQFMNGLEDVKSLKHKR